MTYLLSVFYLIMLLPMNRIGIIKSFAEYFILCTLFEKLIVKNNKIKLSEKISTDALIVSAAFNLYPVMGFIINWKGADFTAFVAWKLSVKPELMIYATAAVLYLCSTVALSFCVRRLSDCFSRIEWYQKPLTDKRIVFVFSVLAAAGIWFFQSDLPWWQTTDDFYISNILNSVYSENNYCYYLSPVLAKLLFFIRKFLPKTNVIILLTHTLVFCGTLCVFGILARSSSLKNALIFFFTILSLNRSINLFNLPYTAITCELAFYGYFILYAVLIEKVERKFSVVGWIFIMFSNMWRIKAYFLIIPFVLLILLTEFLNAEKDGKKMIRRMALLFLPPLLISAAFVGIKWKIDNSELYKTGVEYNLVRTNLVDYPQKTYKECKEEFEKAGISENDLNSIQSLLLADTDTVTTEYMNKIYEISAFSEKEKLEKFILSGFSKIIIFLKEYSNLNVQGILILIFTVIILFSKAKLIYKAEVVLSVIGSWVILLYFSYTGRMMSYIIQAVFFGAWLVLMTFCINEKLSIKCSKLIRIFILSANIIMFTFIYYSIMPKFQRAELTFTAKDQQKIELVHVDDYEDTLYVWGVYDFGRAISSSDYIQNKMLLSENFISHNIVDGEWMYAQPYYVDYMQRIGITNPMSALLNREHTYYVANEKRCDMMLTYMREHVDEKINVERVSSDSAIPIWKFTIN